MERLTTTLLAGAAMSALSVAPAMAGTHSPQPRMAVRTAHGAIALNFGRNNHFKTDVHYPGTVRFTTTFPTTYAFTGKRSTMYRKYVPLLGEAWFTVSAGGHCVDSKVQTGKGPYDTKARIAAHTSKAHTTIHSGTAKVCSGTLTFYGPDYFLRSQSATADSFEFNDILRYQTTSTGTRHRITRYIDTLKMPWKIAIK